MVFAMGNQNDFLHILSLGRKALIDKKDRTICGLALFSQTDCVLEQFSFRTRSFSIVRAVGLVVLVVNACNNLLRNTLHLRRGRANVLKFTHCKYASLLKNYTK